MEVWRKVCGAIKKIIRMNENKGKILGTILFVVLISFLIFLIYSQHNLKKDRKIDMIEITGNKLLSAVDYKHFTDLEDVSNAEGISLSVIKNRFEKHPYVERADVEYAGNHKVIVNIVEKKIVAILLDRSDAYFITGKFQLLPLMHNTRYVDLPLISHVSTDKKIEPLKKFENKEIVEAFKIIEAAKLADADIIKHLSEINMRNGGDIILTFSGIKPPVIFGRGQTAKKIVYLDALWEGIADGKNLIDESEYIDLRFANEIYLGQVEKIGLK